VDGWTGACYLALRFAPTCSFVIHRLAAGLGRVKESQREHVDA
jgi:hypothetical protein